MISFSSTVAEKVEESSYEEPRTYKEALKSLDWEKWIEAMTEEMISLDKNKTWFLVGKLEKHKVVGCKWV